MCDATSPAETIPGAVALACTLPEEALRSVGRELVRNHLKHCASAAIRSEDPQTSEQMYDELVDMMYKHAR